MKLKKPISQFRSIAQCAANGRGYRFLAMLMAVFLFLGTNSQLLAATTAPGNDVVPNKGDQFNASSFMKQSSPSADANSQWTLTQEVGGALAAMTVLAGTVYGGYKTYKYLRPGTEVEARTVAEKTAEEHSANSSELDRANKLEEAPASELVSPAVADAETPAPVAPTFMQRAANLFTLKSYFKPADVSAVEPAVTEGDAVPVRTWKGYFAGLAQCVRDFAICKSCFKPADATVADADAVPARTWKEAFAAWRQHACSLAIVPSLVMAKIVNSVASCSCYGEKVEPSALTTLGKVAKTQHKGTELLNPTEQQAALNQADRLRAGKAWGLRSAVDNKKIAEADLISKKVADLTPASTKEALDAALDPALKDLVGDVLSSCENSAAAQRTLYFIVKNQREFTPAALTSLISAIEHGNNDAGAAAIMNGLNAAAVQLWEQDSASLNKEDTATAAGTNNGDQDRLNQSGLLVNVTDGAQVAATGTGSAKAGSPSKGLFGWGN